MANCYSSWETLEQALLEGQQAAVALDQAAQAQHRRLESLAAQRRREVAELRRVLLETETRSAAIQGRLAAAETALTLARQSLREHSYRPSQALPAKTGLAD